MRSNKIGRVKGCGYYGFFRRKELCLPKIILLTYNILKEYFIYFLSNNWCGLERAGQNLSHQRGAIVQNLSEGIIIYHIPLNRIRDRSSCNIFKRERIWIISFQSISYAHLLTVNYRVSLTPPNICELAVSLTKYNHRVLRKESAIIQ